MSDVQLSDQGQDQGCKIQNKIQEPCKPTNTVKVQECGSVVRQNGESQHPKQILVSDSYFNDAIDKEDTLYSLSMTPVAVIRGARRFLIVLRDRRLQNDTNPKISKPKKISYSVAGKALVFHSTEEVMESPLSSLNRSLLGAQTFRDAQSVGYSPLIMQIPIQAFVEIGSAYRFRQSNESPYYNGVTNPNYFGSCTLILQFLFYIQLVSWPLLLRR